MRPFNLSVLLVACCLGLFSQPSGQGTGVGAKQLRIQFSAPPSISVIRVDLDTANSFPIPAGKSVCIVTRNVAQSQGFDYNVVNNNVVFVDTPSLGDIVQLNCF